MNREIKFRFWDKKEKQMYTWDMEGLTTIRGKYSLVMCMDGGIAVLWLDQEMEIIPHPGLINKHPIRICDPENIVDDLVVLQYTGVKDMHGVEVYEGDIVKVHKFTQELGESLGVKEGETEFIAKIVFSPYGGTRIETKDGYELFLWECEEGWHEESLEVIGNTHQHPELLNS